jgi:hypothetical protein
MPYTVGDVCEDKESHKRWLIERARMTDDGYVMYDIIADNRSLVNLRQDELVRKEQVSVDSLKELARLVNDKGEIGNF